MDHPYIEPTKYNEGKRLVKVEGVFSHFTDSDHAVIDFKNVGVVAISLFQVDGEIVLRDAETKDCRLIIPCWLARDKGIDYVNL